MMVVMKTKSHMF